MAPLNLRPPGFFGANTVEISPPARTGETGIRRLAVCADRLITTPDSSIVTVPDIISYAARTHEHSPALGWRDVIKVHEEVKEVKKKGGRDGETERKTWKYFELSEYKYLDYVQLKEAISEVARALVDIGIGTEDVVDIFAQTSVNWQLISHACALISTTAATAYDTLGESGLTHSLNEPKCIAVFTNPELLPMVARVLPHTPTVRYVFYDGQPSTKQLDEIKGNSGIRAIHIDELRTRGRELSISILDSRKPTPSTTACIMYTSGSTGTPKGVILTHANLIAAVGAVHFVFSPHLPAGGRYIAYLPLAHVLEYVVELCAVFCGIASGYARPKTLTDASVRGCRGDLAALRPNVLFGVPAVYETIRKAVLARVDGAGRISRAFFYGALTVKRWAGAYVPGVSWVVDRIVFKKIQEAVGGDITFAVNGGAGISKATQEFFNDAVMPLTQGYGLTETSGMGAFLPPELLSYSTLGAVGIPGPCLEVKLVDVPELGYFTGTGGDDNVSGGSGKLGHLQQGEIWLRGMSVTPGYFNREDLNSDPSVFTEEDGVRWFRTGDIGQWNADGTLSVVDRVKNLVKMRSGEYIALERLESTYKSSTLVSNLCIIAGPEMAQPVAVVVPHEGNLRAELSSSEPLPDLCQSTSAQTTVLKSLASLAKKNGFARMEIPCAVLLSSEEWTSENGMCTAAGKVNRARVREVWGKEVDRVVLEGGD
ncbi:Long-chain-fatty-acid--CoA ligase 2 [Psilocybe cubensis]|uniref:AMP-dependent synthetase/ligase domain-containing protein n=2 Tax=Psilocybe cubensis TaxID=181762 RepID=A0A8H7XSB2_PSICU|nr:Long-chain-fatty-acid--CoA ligase 2 [Psilocybe cubensis]KAH9478102.1 Long-chain-fatty-acid--CoA ligase 2 [Psilocybe cubensis]